jgi:hypothetical protein
VDGTIVETLHVSPASFDERSRIDDRELGSPKNWLLDELIAM